jgi:hypothetical protein
MARYIEGGSLLLQKTMAGWKRSSPFSSAPA